MILETEEQRARICETLVNLVGLRNLWSWCALEEAVRPVVKREGELIAHWSDYACPWSGGQKRMLGVAWSFWNQSHCAVGFGDVVFGLDEQGRAALADLLLLGTSAEWLDKWRPNWKTERLEHYDLAQWQEPAPGDVPEQPYWLAMGEFSSLDAVEDRATKLEGRLRIQRITGRVDGPRAIEVVEQRVD